MAATSAANIAEALVIIPPGSIRWKRRLPTAWCLCASMAYGVRRALGYETLIARNFGDQL